jgi:hypothetical protein
VKPPEFVAAWKRQYSIGDEAFHELRMLGVGVPSLKKMQQIFKRWLGKMPQIRFDPAVFDLDGKEVTAARADVDLEMLLAHAVAMAELDGVMDPSDDVVLKIGIDGTSVCVFFALQCCPYVTSFFSITNFTSCAGGGAVLSQGGSRGCVTTGF